MVGSGRLAEHSARKPDGGAKKDLPFPSLSAVPAPELDGVFAAVVLSITPANVGSCPKLKLIFVDVECGFP